MSDVIKEKRSGFREIKDINELLSDYKILECCGKKYTKPTDFFEHLKKCPASAAEAAEIRKTRDPIKPKSKCAYITLVMQGDRYVAGGVILGHSFRMVKTKHDTICMVNGVSTEGVELLKMTFDHVVEVPLLRFVSREFKSDIQKKMYAHMEHTVYTKWCALMFEEYEKLFFIDCDTSAVQNFDNIFGLEPPAAHASYEHFSKDPDFMRYVRKHPLKQGQAIPASVYINYINTTGGMTANILLAPNIDDFTRLKIMIKAMEPFHAGNGVFGGDEQSITLYNLAVGKEPTKYLTDKYFGAMFWKLRHQLIQTGSQTPESPPFIHYFGSEKPWYKGVKWPDIAVWWSYYYDLPEEVRAALYKKEGHRFEKSEIKNCMYCVMFDKMIPEFLRRDNPAKLTASEKNHRFIQPGSEDKPGRIICPRITRLKL